MPRLITTCAMVLLLLVGCSKGGSPVAPETERDDAILHPVVNGHNLLGLWTMEVDPGGSWTATPLRTGDFHMNVRVWLENPDKLLRVLTAQPLPGNALEARIEITHPFDDAAMWGFDVRGICILPGSRHYSTINQWVSDESLGDPVLANAEGYTNLWNPAQFAGSGIFAWSPGRMGRTPPINGIATVNGYRNFFTDRERHVFEPGGTTSAYYQMRLNGPLKFTYAVDVSWRPPKKSPPSGPDDFPISANMPEAYRVAGALYHTYAETGTGDLTVDIYDWQGHDSVDKVRYEFPAELGGATGELPMTNFARNEARFRATVSGTTSEGGERILIEVTDKVTDPRTGPARSYAFATVLPPNYLPWPQSSGPRFDGARRCDALGPMVPELEILQPPVGYDEVPYVLVHHGDYLVGETHNSSTFDSNMTVFDPEGNLIWDSGIRDYSYIYLNFPDIIFSTFGYAYPDENRDYYFDIYNLSGDLIYTKDLEIESWDKFHLGGISNTGSVYTVQNSIGLFERVNSTGEIDWSYTNEIWYKYGFFLDHPNGFILIRNIVWSDNEQTYPIMIAIDQNADELWRVEIPYTYHRVAYAIGPSGVIYAVVNRGMWDYSDLIRVAPDGTTISDDSINHRVGYDDHLAVCPDETILVLWYSHEADEETLAAFDPDGQLKWEYGHLFDNHWLNTDIQGNVYLCSGDPTQGGLISLDPDGLLRWRIPVPIVAGDSSSMDGRGRIIPGKGIYADSAD